MSAVEEWRPIPSLPDYEASSLGRIRSVKRSRPQVVGAWPDPSGYLRFKCSTRGEGQRWVAVHRVVAEAFHGPRPEEMQTRHLDGDKTNNAPGNLQYGTSSENVRDQVEHGAHFQANKTHCRRNHPYDETNTRRWGGARYCQACRSEQQRVSKRRARLARPPVGAGAVVGLIAAAALAAGGAL